MIKTENGEVPDAGRYVTIVLLMPLTVSEARPSTISLSQILHSLEGSYTALYRANHSHAFGDPSLVKIQLLLANQGSRQDADPNFIDGILRVSQPDHPVVAVIGLGSSVNNTKITADHLAKQGIPMVSAVASADDLTMLPLLWSVSPSTSDYTQALKLFLDRQNTLKSGVIVYDRNPDVYTQSLVLAYRAQLGRYIKFPDQLFRGNTMESQTAPDVFYPVVTNLCNAAKDPNTPLDVVFYAGRGADFGAFTEALKARACVQQPLVVLVGENRFTTTKDYKDLLKGGNFAVFYATSSDTSGWGKNSVDAPPGYAAFLAAYHDRGFLDDGDLADGYAIAHHDALATAAQAIRLVVQNGQTHVPNPQDVVNEFGHLDMVHAVPAASGTLRFRPMGGRADGQLITIQQLK
ncbi:MAG: hypothetical protein DLM61_27465 [Pseudonocardiales bacterium]|nr:MAG: hypothetical protein DLM61_27465 [Pseudonocardiales bacterium]